MSNMKTFYVTFGMGGPLKNKFGVIQTDDEITTRMYLKEHFPKDWCGLYTPKQFEHQEETYGLKQIFEVTVLKLQGVVNES